MEAEETATETDHRYVSALAASDTATIERYRMNPSRYDKPVYRPPAWFWIYAVVMLVFIGWCIGMLT